MSELSWRRIKKGSGFSFVTKTGKLVPESEMNRIKKLSIPPAWVDVTISKYPRNNIQATGIDAKGRKQYIYNENWVKKNQEKKFDQMIMFGERLPYLREAVRAHMREETLSQNRVIATVVWLLEHTFIRVGNDKYAIENESYGLTTMREKHLKLRGNKVTFNFKGKSGVFHELDVTNENVAKTIKECIDLPGYEIFQYLDEDGNKRVVGSADVNNYIEVHTGKDFSAKDFRTWGASVLAGHSLFKLGSGSNKEDIKNNISEVVEIVSTHLGNTKKVCRTYYIHPVIISSYEKDILVPHFKRSYGRKSTKKLSLTQVEYATWSLIKDS